MPGRPTAEPPRSFRKADRHRESVRRRDAYLEKRLSEKKAKDSERVAVFPKESKA